MHKTIYDVAEDAGVSISTVSRALNNSGYVSKKTRDKIERAMEGFFPNAAAQTMSTKRSFAIGIVSFLSPQRFFFSGTLPDSLGGMVDYANANGYRLLLDIGSADTNCITLYRQKKIDGIIFVSMVEDLELHKQLVQHNIPAVFMGDVLDADDYIRVSIDNRKGAFDAVDYLISLGHRKIAMIGGVQSSPAAENRCSGYRLALSRSGIAVDEGLVVFCSQSIEAMAFEAALELLRGPSRPTAVFAYNDDMAIGVYRAARQLDLSIPRDLSVIGFDDSKIASLTSPALTTISQPSYYKGRLTAEKIIQYINNLNDGDGEKPLSEKLECNLVIRASCCPPK